MGDEQNSESFLQKLSDLNSRIISKLNLLPPDIMRLKNVVANKVFQPKQVLNQNSLPIVKESSSVPSNVIKSSEAGSEVANNLFEYFQVASDIQSKGLVHGTSGDNVCWTKLLPKKNLRSKTEEKGIIMNFFEDKENSSGKKNIFDYDSSDDFEDEIVLKETKADFTEDDQLLVQTDPKQDQPISSKPQSPEWIGKSASGRKDPNSSINRLKLPKGKRKLQLGTPDKDSESGLIILSTSPETSTSGAAVKSGSMQKYLKRSLSNGDHKSPALVRNKNSQPEHRQEPGAGSEATNTSKDVSGSDDDSIEIVLEVASNPNSKENTPNKLSLNSRASSRKSCDSPAQKSSSTAVSNQPPAASGSCPLCGREMTIPLLVKHSANCEGPEQGPSLRNSNGKERRKF